MEGLKWLQLLLHLKKINACYRWGFDIRCSFQSLLSWQLFHNLLSTAETKATFNPGKPAWATSLAAPPGLWVLICPGFPLRPWPWAILLLPPPLCCVTAGWDSQRCRQRHHGHHTQGSGHPPPPAPHVLGPPVPPTPGLHRHSCCILQPQPQVPRTNSWSAFNDPKPLHWLRRQLNLSQG